MDLSFPTVDRAKRKRLAAVRAALNGDATDRGHSTLDT